ncbi:hypothetical protein PK28_06675 [Hymenobacter sp. DG25B]|nr:hypothetical protein PK28_06675 [Hymenobacter sp. DG25B]
MKSEYIKAIINKLEKLMYGHNYQVYFSFHIFTNCSNKSEFNNEINKHCIEFSEDSQNKTPIELDDFWKRINYGLNYRGDTTAGLHLDQHKEKELEKATNEYISFINEFIKPTTIIYSTIAQEGIYWSYSFLLRNDDKSLYISGCAED